MKLLALTAWAMVLAAPCLAQDRDHVRPSRTHTARPAPKPAMTLPPATVLTAKEADDFIVKVEAES